MLEALRQSLPNAPLALGVLLVVAMDGGLLPLPCPTHRTLASLVHDLHLLRGLAAGQARHEDTLAQWEV